MAITSHQLGTPRSAKNITGKVVMSNSSMMRGLHREMYARTVDHRSVSAGVTRLAVT